MNSFVVSGVAVVAVWVEQSLSWLTIVSTSSRRFRISAVRSVRSGACGLPDLDLVLLWVSSSRVFSLSSIFDILSTRSAITSSRWII